MAEEPTQQSRKESLMESGLNVFSGWLISLVLWMFVIAPAFGIQSSLAESALINGIFTVISIVRGYFWRRLFVNKFFWRKSISGS